MSILTTNKRKVTATILATIVGVSTLGVAAFAVDDTKEVRQADFIASLGACDTCVDERTSGHYEFLEEGLHAYTDDNSSEAKVALYFAPRGGDDIPTTVTQDWYGTSPAPGAQIVFDYDGTNANGNDYNILVVESVYNGEVWLTGSSSADAKAADPDGPGTGANSGYDHTGTLQEWKDAMPNARVLAYGFSLGSGIKGDGVLRAQTYGSDEYIFTDETNAAPGTPEAHTQSAPVVANLTWANANKKTDIYFTSNNPAANDTLRGTKVAWRITVDGVGKFSSTMGWGEQEHYVDTYPKSDPNHVVRVYKNGALFSTRTVTTN